MTWPFENDTSAVEKKLARRSIKADKRRSVFVILTIALAVCLMGTLCFLYSAQQLKTLDGILGQYQAGCGGLTREEAIRLADSGRLEKWGYTVDAGTVRYEDSVLNISFVSPEMIDLMGYGEVTGHYPQGPNELCVERAFFRYFGLSGEVGQTVALDLGDGEKTYTVTGILEAENDSRIFTVWIPETAVEADGHNAPYELRFRFAGSQGMEPGQLRLEIERFFVEMGVPEDRTFYSSNYFGMVDLYLGNGMEVYVAAALIAIVCAIVIYSIFYISVMGKLREYGRLKVLGTTPKQLKRVVKRERRWAKISFWSCVHILRIEKSIRQKSPGIPGLFCCLNGRISKVKKQTKPWLFDPPARMEPSHKRIIESKKANRENSAGLFRGPGSRKR